MYDQLAQPIYQDPNTGARFSLEPGVEVFDLVLAGSAEQRDLSQTFPKDSGFLVTGLAGVSTGDYKLQIQLPDGTLLTSAPVRNVNLIGTAQFPTPIFPAVKVPAGGRIGITSITDLSGNANTIQIVFLGVRLYPLSR
jgi:hypothetical protein